MHRPRSQFVAGSQGQSQTIIFVMHMSDQTEYHFNPDGDQPTLISIWRPALYVFLVLLVLSLLTRTPIFIFALFVAYARASDEYLLQVSISLDSRTLEYIYLNGFGQEKRKTIDIPTAVGKYRNAKTGRNRWAWQLTLRNSSRPYEKMVLTADRKKAFTKVQLDEISELIDQCKR